MQNGVPKITSSQRKSSQEREGKIFLTLKPPAVPAFMIKSGCNAWIAAYVTREEDIVPTLSTPERNGLKTHQMKF